MKYRHFIFGILLLASAALLAPGCRKIVDPNAEDLDIPVIFNLSVSKLTKTDAGAKNTAMETTYDTRERFVTYALFHENPFASLTTQQKSESNNLMTSVICSHQGTAPNDYWAPSTSTYYWLKDGYLTFQAYSPAVAFEDMSGTPKIEHSWDSGFTFHSFTVRPPGEQYDLLYSPRVKDRHRSLYSIYSPYDETNGDQGPYKGVDLPFKHALSLIEIHAVNSLGANDDVNFYVQTVEIRRAYETGTGTCFNINEEPNNTGISWTNQDHLQSYTVLNLSGEANPDDQWQQVAVAAGSGSHNTKLGTNTLMLLPQNLHHSSGSSFDESTDVYVYVKYKRNNGSKDEIRLPLYIDEDNKRTWEPGNKYIYLLTFSDPIQFSATIAPWVEQTGTWTIIK